MTEKISGYKYIGVDSEICSGEPIIIGTRLRALFIAQFGTMEDILFSYPQLTKEQVEEAKLFHKQYNG